MSILECPHDDRFGSNRAIQSSRPNDRNAPIFRTLHDVIALAASIADLYAWAVEEGLRGSTALELFDGFCQRLVTGGMPLLRGYVSTQTLHPQWSGYGYTWRRDLNGVYAQQFSWGADSQEWRNSPFYAVISRARAGEKTPWLRRRLELGPEQCDFPALRDFYAAGATDYLCVGYRFGEGGDPAHGTGVVYSFSTDRSGGFEEEEIQLLRSTLPGLSLAMKAHAGYDIASGLLRTYLGYDAGRRVHSGDIECGAVNGLHAVLWYAAKKPDHSFHSPRTRSYDHGQSYQDRPRCAGGQFSTPGHRWRNLYPG